MDNDENDDDDGDDENYVDDDCYYDNRVTFTANSKRQVQVENFSKAHNRKWAVKKSKSIFVAKTNVKLLICL